jgi:jasmonate ZIM domain-containing protein
LEPERAQLTIFYDGRTFVLDDFPADKADQLMQLAGSFAAPAASDDELVCPSMPAQHFLEGIPALQNPYSCSVIV